MQSIRSRGANRAERRERAVPRRHGLFSTTALIPAIAALAGGAMTLAPGQAQAQTVVTSGAAVNGFGDNTLCLDPARELCPIDLGAVSDAPPPVVSDLATGSAGRSLLIGGGDNGSQFFTVTSDGYEFNNDFNTQNPLVLSFPVTIVRAIGSSSFHQQSISETGGSRVLRKTGSETLFLLGFDNTYSGGTIVSEGFLGWDRDRAFGIAGTGVTIDNGAGVNWTGSFATTRAFTLTGGFATMRAQSGVTGTVNGTISGPGGLTVGGPGLVAPGTIVLGGNNTYQGGTSIVGGTLIVTNNNSLGTLASGTTVSAGATLAVQGGLTGLNEGIALSGTGMGGAGALRNLSGNNVLTGGVTVAGAALITSDAGLLDLAGPLQSSGAFGLTFGGAGSVSLRGQIVGSISGLTKTGTGTLILGSGFNPSAYSAGLDLAQGTVSVRTNLGAGFGTIRTTGSVIDIGQGINNGADVVLNSNTTQFQVTTGTGTQSGVISEIGGARPIEKIGAGSLILSGTNMYSGGTTISAGTLAFTSNANLGAATGGITIGNATLSMTAAANITSNRAFNLTAASGINVGNGGTYTIVGDITGTGSLSKALSGTLVLTGTNSYAGATTVSQGILQVGDGGTTGTLGASAVTVNSTLIFNRSNDFTVANDIGGGGALTKSGGGTLTLTGAKTYIGQTSVTGGTLVFGGTSAYTGSGALDVSGGNFTLGVDATFSDATQASNTVVTLSGRTMTLLTGNYSLNGGSITGPGTIDIRNNNRGLLINTASAAIGADVTINGAGGGTPFVQLNMSADYSLLPTITGANLQLRLFNTDSRTTISGNNSFGGGTVLSTGTAVVASDTALGTGTLTMAANTGLEAGGTGDRTLANAITLNGIGTSITNPNANSSFTLSGIIGGSNRLTKFGAGTVILTGANAYSGGTTVAGGTLQIGSGSLAGSLGTGSVTIGTNGTLAFNSSASQNVNNTLGGAGSLIKAGSGTLTLGGTNAFTGAVSLDGGALQLTGGSAFGDTAALSMATGTLLGVGSSETIGSLAGNGTVVLQASSVLTTGGNNNSTTFAGSLTGLGGLTKTGSGTFTLTGTSNFVGTTTISGGTLQIGNATTTGTIIGGPIVNNASLVFNRSDNIDSNVAISGTGSLTKLGAGTLTLLNTNSYAGGTTISAGILQLGSGSTTGSLGTGGVTISTNGTLRSNSSATQTIAGALAGSGSLVQQGTGTTILGAAANGYSGTAQIFAGTLQLGNLTALGTGAVELRGGSLHLANAGVYTNAINAFTADGNVLSTVAGSQITLTGQFGGAGTLRLAPGTGSTLDIAAATGTAGATTRIIVQSGTVRSQGGILGQILGLDATQTQVDAGATLNFNTRLSTISNLSGAGTILNDGSTTTLRNGTFSGAFGGTQSLATTGNISLSGSSSYSGTTTVQSGTLTISSSSALGSNASGTTVNSGATLEIVGSSSPALAVSDALTISGTGVGGTGALRIVPNASAGSQGVNLTGGVTLAADSTITVADRIALTFNTGGIALGSSTLTFASEGTGNSGIFVSSAISGTGGLIKNAASAFTLSGANTFTGPFALNVGDASLNGGAALADTVAVSMLAGTRLFVNSSETIGSLAGAGLVSLDTNVILTTGGNNASTTFAGTIGSNGGLTKTGTGRFTLTGASTYNGTTTISGGALQIGAGGTTGSITSNSIINNGFLEFNRSDAITYSGAISGTGRVTKLGAGELTLSGVNSYSNGTQVLGGTLIATNGNSLGSGAGFVSVSGGATLSLVNAGTVANRLDIAGTGVGAGGALHAASGTQTLTGIIDLNADTLFSVAAGATLNVQGSTLTGTLQRLTIDNAGTVSISNSVNGLRSLTKTGTGTLTLSGTNNSMQALFVNAGRVNTQMGAAIPDFTAVTVASGATLDIQGLAVETIGSLTGAGTVLISDDTGTLRVGNDNTSTLFSGNIGGGGGLIKTGTGTLTLSGTNTFGRITSIDNGTLVLQGGAALSDTAQVFVDTFGTLRVEAGETIGGIGGPGSIVLATTGPLVVNAQQNLTYSGVISQSGVIGSFTNRGPATQTITAAQTFTGQTSVEAGQLALTGSGALASTSISTSTGARLTTDGGALAANAIISHAGILTLSGSETIGSISGTGAISLFNATLSTGNASDATLSGIISGTNGALIKTGTGTLTLSGANTYNGGTTISAGTLVLNQVAGGTIGAAGTSQITIASGGNLLSNVTGTLANRFFISSSTNASIGAASGTTLTLTGDQFVTAPPFTLTFGSSSATGTIDLAMPSGVTIGAGMRANIAGGTVRTSTSSGASILGLASGGTTIGTSAASATLDVNGLSFNLVNLGGNTSGTLTNLGAQAATTTVNSASASTFAGTITNGAAALNLTKFGNATLTLTGSNSYSGITNILRGTLQIGEGGTTGTLGTGAVTLDALGNLTFNRSNDLIASNAISGAGSLTKVGAGTTTLTGDLSGLSGAVTVTAGTLQIGNGGTTGSIGTGAVTNNATLAINLASDITLAQAISGTGALRKLGTGVATITSNLALGSATVEAGTLALSGSNSFTNGITVAGGTLSLRSANAAGGATGIIRTTGSVIDYADGIDMATQITLASNTTQLQVLTGSATQSGAISEQDGARPLEKIGAGTLTLSGVNTYSGGTTISAGRLNISSNANLGATSGGITIGNAILGSTGLISSARAVSLTGAAGIDVSNSSLTLTSAVTGGGSLTKTGNGQLVLTANNAYAGTTTISGSGGLTVGSGGTTGTLGAGNITINSGSFLAFSRSDAFTVANVISGQGNLGKQGSSTLTLTGANSFTGGLNIAAGTVVLASANAGVINAAGTGNITFSSNTTLRTDVSGTLGNNLLFGSGSSTVAAASGTTLRLAPSVLLFEAGAGSPLNFGTASATGTIELAPVTVSVGAQVNPININGGTLRLAGTGAYTLLNGANDVFLNGATLGADVAGTLTKVLTIGTTGGTIDVAAASLTLQGANAYNGVLTKTGTGELRLTGAATGSSAVQLNAGSLALLASNAGWGTGTLQMATGTTLRLGLPSPATLANNIVLGEGAGSTIIAPSTTFSGALSGGALTIASGLGADGPSVVRLTGTNSYGATTIGAGNTLLIGTVGNNGTLGTGNVTVNTGATLRFEGNNNTVGNVISGAGRLVRDGLGTTTLTAANSYAGGTVISGGGIEIGNAGALGSGGLTMSGSTSLTTSAGISASVTGLTIGNFANVSLSAASGQTLSLGGTLDFGNFATSLVFGTLAKTGTVAIGFASSTGPVSSASIRVDAGTLRLAAASDAFLLRAGGGLTVAAGGTLDLNGFAGGGVNLTGAGAITNASLTGAQFEASQNAASTFSGLIGGGTGAISLVKSGTGALTLTGANTYTGTTSITGGSLQIGNGGTTGSIGTGNVSIASGAQLLLNRSDALSLANVFTGAGTIQKNLANVLTLTGSNTNENGFTGTLNVNGGTLLVNGTLGDLANRAATVNVASGAALGGSGTIQGNVVVANGGILSPGNSPATQTITGNLSLNDSSVLNFELAQAGIVGSGINDLVNVGGNLVLDGTLNVTALEGFTAGFYRLINYGGTLTNNQLVIGTQPMGFSSELRTDIAGQVNILFNAGGQTVQYWDGADLTGATATVNGEGGAGNWTSAATNWTNPTGFAVNSAWAGQAGVFAGTAGGTVSITGSQAFQELRFLTDGYTLNAADLTGGLATTGGFSIVNVNSGIATRINAPISGTAGLIKTGGGTLTLGGANSYAGLTTVSGGTLSLVSGGTIAGAVQNNATLSNAGTINGLLTNAGTLTSTGTLAGGLTNNAGATANVAGSFGGSAITNSGTLTLTGATTGIGAFTQNVGGVFNLTNVSTSIGSLAGSGQVLMSAGGLTLGSANTNTDYAGTIAGSGVLVKTGTGTQTLSGTSTFLGSTLIAQGSLVLATGTSFASALQNNATFINAGTTTGLVTNSGTLTSTGTLAGGLVNNGGATANIAGTLTGAVTNSGTITLTGITTGIGALTVNSGGVFNLAGFGTTVGSLTGAGSVQLGAATLTAGGDNASTTFSGQISGTGALTKTGSGTLTLTGANGFAGLTTIGQGSLSIGSTGSLAGAALNNASLVNAGSIAGLITNAATLTSTGTLGGGLVNNANAAASVRGTLNGPVTNSGTITLTGATTGNAAVSQTTTGTFNLAGFDATIGSLAGSGSVQLGSGTLTLGGANNSTDFGGVLSGAGALVKTGTATQTLSGANTFTGLTTINQGSIFLATGASLAGAVQNNATFINSGRVAGLVTNAGTLVSAGTLAGGLVNNAGATASLANTVNGTITNSGAITLTADLSGAPGFTQNTGGSLNLAGFSATLGSIAGAGAIQLGSGTLTAGDSNASTSFDGIISGSGTFNKAGTGTLTLGGSNTAAANFTGTVNANAGSLVLNGQFGDVVANSATLSLTNGATLGGSGSFLGNLSLGTGAILAPGNSPATLNIGGNLLLDSASVLNFELAQAGVVGSGINDLITVGGNLTLDGTLNIAALTGFGEGIYRLINYGGTLTDNGLLVGTRPDGFTSSLITNVAGQVSVQFTVGVPTVLYWDGTDTTAASSATNGNGGSGIWSSTSTNWTAAPGFSTAFPWNSQTGIFAGAAGGTVQISGTQAFQQLRFETGGYVLNAAAGGGGLATTGGTSVIDVSAGLAATINAPIQGTAGLSKAGTGTLTLGGANTYSGLTSVAAGTLALSAGGTVAGAAENNATFTNAGTVTGQVTNRATLISTGALAGGLVNASGATASLAGTVAGAVSNAGTITLTGATTGIGALTQAGGAFNLAGFSTTIGSLSGNGSVALGNGTLTTGGDNSSSSFAGVISGNGGLTKAGTGTLTLSGANTYSGLTSIAAGTLALSAGGAIAGAVENNATFSNAGTVAGQVTNRANLISTGALNGGLVNASGATASLAGSVAGAVSNSGTITLTGVTTGIGAFSQSGGSLNLSGFDTTIGSLAGNGTVVLGGARLTAGGDNSSTTFGGAINGIGGLIKTGSGTLTLTGTSTIAGSSTVNGGQLVVAAGARLGGSLQNNATFTNAGTVTGAVRNDGILVSTGTLAFGITNVGNATASLSGAVTGAVFNSGRITLTGTTTGIGGVTLQGGGVFNMNGFNTDIAFLEGTGSFQLGSGTLTIGGNFSTSFSGVISGSGNLVKAGNTQLSLANAQSFTGLTTVSGGALNILGTGALAGALLNNSSVNNAGRINGLVTNSASLFSTGVLNGGLTNTATGMVNLSGQLNGPVTNAGMISINGPMAINATVNQSSTGRLNIAPFVNASLGGLSGSGTVGIGASGIANSTLTVGGNNASTSFTGTFFGGGTLVKTGTGTLTLGGTIGHTGTTFVNAGALVLSAGSTMAGPVTNSATFTNAGTVAGGVINSGALVSTGRLNAGLVNNAGASANIAGVLTGNLINRGTVNLTGTTTGIAELSLTTGATFNLGGFATTIGNLTGGGGTVALGSATLTLGSGTGSQTFDGTITGTGGLTKVSASTFSLSGAQTYTGLTTIAGGTFILGSNASLAGALLNNANVASNGRIAGLVTNNATLNSTGALNGGLVNAAGALAQVRGTLAGAVSNAGTITLTGAISGIGAVTQDATGTFNLGGFNTSIGSLAGSGSVLLGAATLTTGGDNSSTSFAGAIAGDGGLVKTGTGTFILTGANTYAGLTTVSQGVISVRNNAGLGGNAAGTVVDAGAALELQGGITITGEALTINGTGVNGAGALRNLADNNIWAGTVTLGSDSLITADAGRLDIDLLAGTTQALTTGGAGLIGLANANTTGALTVTGGNLALFGSGNFAGGVNVNAGNLFLQGGSSVNDAAAVTLGTGNLIVAVSETIGSLAGAGGTVQIDAGQTLTLGGSDASTSFGGVIFNTGNLAKQGSGTFTVTGMLAHTGSTAITGGTLLSGAANIWQGNGLVTIGSGGTLDLGGFDQSIAAISLAGGALANGALTGSISSTGGTIRDISGAANALTTVGGTTTLTGTGSFAQGVTLAGGDLVLQGAGASIADTALVTVNTGTLFVNVGETIGALAGSGGRVQIAANQALVTGGSNASTAYAGVIAGNGAVTKTGTGTFTLSGANTLTGTITVNAGVLALTSGGSLAGAVQNAAGFSNAGTVAGLVTNTGTLISTGVLNGGLVNSGSAGLSGQLVGAVTNSGLIQLQGVLTGIIGFSQTGAGTFDLAGFNTSIGSLSGAGNVLLGSATLTLGGSNASTSFGGTIGGTGGLNKVGSGSFTLTSGQAYTGLTSVNGGLLTVAAGAGLSGSVLNNTGFASSGLILGSLTNNGAATLAGQINGAVVNAGSIVLGNQLIVQGRFTQNAGGTLNLGGFSTSFGSLSGVGPIALGSGTLVVGSDNSSSLFSGVISGSGGLAKVGTGTFTLTGINSYTGLTVVNAGTLVIGEGASVGGTTSGVSATIAAPSAAAAPVAVAAEHASMPAPVTSLVAEQASMPATVGSLAAETASTVSASLASRAGMMVDNGSISGGPTPASLTSSAERLPLAGGVSSGPERVDLFGDSTSGAVSADLPVVTLSEASQTLAATTATPATASAAGRLGLVSDLSNGMGTARLDGALLGGTGSASPVAASLVDPIAPVAAAGETAFAGPLSTAVIAGSVLNNANLINNGSILGQLVNSAGATAVNNGVIRGLVTNAGTFTSTGTLSGGLSNSGTARISGTLTGDVLNSGSITLTGITSGIAVFQQAATGSLNLAGFDTTIGVLSGAGTISLGSARLTTGTNGANSLFSGVISGTGALTKTGTGGLILDGDNSYSGGTTIAGGTLQLGNGGTTGSIVGPVLNNGTLVVNRSNAYTFAGVISGTGAFIQAGTGTTTLTGANSYSGGTLISAGRLIGSTVSLQGLIQNDAALEFAQGTNGVFAGRIGGTGLLDKSGVGLLELTGDSSALRGATTVRTGELRVTGSLGGSATTVLSGATLSGNGTVGGLIARSGSVVSPGAGSLGMLGVNGAIHLQQGSTLRLQVQAPSGSDMLIGNGTMQLGGTAAITNLGGTYAFNSNYLLLQASGGRTGTFDAVTGFGEFGILYRPELVYTANQVLLRMAPNLLTNIVGATPLTANQRSVVSRIDAAVTAGYNPQPLFNVYALPNAQQPNAFDQLSGEVYATMAGVGSEQERLVREAVLGRINAVAATARQTPEWGNGAGAWGQVFGSWGDGERDGNAARYESDRQGFITGIDYGNANSEGSWRIGAFGVHMTSKVRVDARGSRAEVEQTGGGLYAGVNTGGVSVGMGASVTGVDLSAVRTIALPGFAETNQGRGNGRAVQGFAEIGYAIEAGQATYRPFASVAVGEFKLDALTETGGAAALAVRRQRYRSGSITVGADGMVHMGKVQLSGTLAGRFQVGDRDPAAQIALAAAPAQAFTIRGVQLDSFALSAKLDATVALSRNADLSLGYTGLIGKDTADHGARATLSVRF